MFRRFAALLRQLGTTEKRRTPCRVRLGVEILEDRAVPADASGIATGTAFLDANGNGIFDGADANVQGASISLVGTTSQTTPVNTTVSTDQNGNFKIDNILPGTYTLSIAKSDNVVGAVLLGNLSLPAGVTVIQQTSTVTRGGLAVGRVSLAQFMTSTTQADYAYGAAGSGNALANFRANNAPTNTTALATLNIASNAGATTFNLAKNFTDSDFTNSRVTFNFTYAGQDYTIAVDLLDTTAPQTVANFFNYVNEGEYTRSIISRLVSGFVLQGGGTKANSTGTLLSPVDTHGQTVDNEFGASNVQGTLSMAKQDTGTPAGLNTASSQWFFNLADNSGAPNNLDANTNAKKFTVFGRIADSASFTALTQLAAAAAGKTQDFSGITSVTTANPGVDFEDVPMSNYTGSSFPTDASLEKFMVLNSVAINKRDEFLSYGVEVTSGASVVNASIDRGRLIVSPKGPTGAATVKVTATDRYGVSTTQTFTVNVEPGPVSLTQSIVSISPSTIATGGTATVTLTAKDANGNQLTTGGLTVTFAVDDDGTSTGTLSNAGAATSNGDGTYSATFSATVAGTANKITAKIGTGDVTSTATFTVT